MLGLGKNTVQKQAQDHVFSRVSSSSAVEYSTFNMPLEWHGTIDSGYLIPFCAIEVIPGDFMKLNSRHLVRCASPMLVPIMQNLYCNYEFFYVKNRMIYDKWKKLMGEQRNPNDSTDYLVPMLNTGNNGVERKSIFDCFGIRANIPNYEFSALPLRAYNLIYNEWYRDENLQEWRNVGGTGTSANPVDEFGESDQLSNYILLKRNKPHDYFTSMLPWQQKGEAVVMNLQNTTAPVYSDGNPMRFNFVTPDFSDPHLAKARTLGQYAHEDAYRIKVNDANFTISSLYSTFPDSVTTHGVPVTSGLQADLTNVLGISIADFRTAMQIQAIKELDARGGTRYQEKIWNEFQVKIADAELHRPELLAQFKHPFYTTPIAQTSATTSNADETAQGNLSAVTHAYVDRGYDFVKGFDDYGYVIGLLSITTDNNYQQGLHKKWSRQGRYDFYHPLLQHISEQAVKRKELIVQSDDVLDDDGTPINESTLGYQEAWAEYKYGEKIITGDLVSDPDNPSNSLDRWHLAPYFDPETTKLNSEFIEFDIPLERTLAITGTEENPQPQFIVDSYCNCKMTRPMALYSIPSYLGSRF